ncbi:MAG: hypothetical protein AVDCRST_MAG77-1622 [uncultured Chloroflexi bacterium]|uniref:Uncharacterized protein n=1 Tax=uncultured Chloroflexota bacterium TaxID=166587 RepID=A0A6J4I538_9CHLR|nr:MAG: hypothetical protein AVDCRST_MAG77-1622 [uncultured Chloroflexota bacterium]
MEGLLFCGVAAYVACLTGGMVWISTAALRLLLAG